jgi:hypothetical protein
VELMDWQLPKYVRPGRVENKRARLFFDGRLADVPCASESCVLTAAMNRDRFATLDASDRQRSTAGYEKRWRCRCFAP